MNRNELPAVVSTVVCVLGMHRSGTSAVSRLLNLLGVDLGPPQAMAAAGADNPKGYWEHRAFVEINEAILARFGARWDERPTWPAGWAADSRFDDLRTRARAMLREDFGAAPVWGWKDPRTCLTLPFWQAVVGPMRYVICVRNPRAVASSLRRRDGMSPEQAGAVWLHHLELSLIHTSRHPRHVIFYEDLITDWAPELRHLAAFLGRRQRADDVTVQKAASEFLEASLCHHRSSMDALIEDPRIPLQVKNLYVSLRHEARATERPADADAAVEGGAALRAQRDRLAADIADLADEATTLRRERQTALAEMKVIRTSTAWRIACAIWRVVDLLFPRGTRRRVVYNAVVPQSRRRPA